KDVGMVQTRWGHLNPFHNLLTRPHTIALDGHLVVEQVARSRNDLLFNFNGSAGVWRKKCIIDSGGWQSDTIAEDLDLSYRAQIRGWDFRYLFDIVSPAEIPSELISFKSQQFRWVKGSVQCLCKHLLNIIRHSKFSFWQRYQAIMHLGGYLMHPMMLCFLISTVPYMLYADTDKLLPTWLGFAGFGPPLLYAVAQISAYRDGLSRFVWFPVLMVLGLGVAVNNTKAVIEALFGYKSDDFVRTPKSSYVSNEENEFYANSNYLLVFLEILFGIYAFVSLFISISKFPSMSPFLAFFFIGFILVAIFSYLETSRLLKKVKE
ncbi:MAG TPA: glycosyl transferase, partial [Chloroflexi bacterium]|nr:glycosyl transferase [Chloroflexota bacterium]